MITNMFEQLPGLPDRPSGMIRLGLADLERAENDSRYVVDMNDWHRPDEGVCLVCMAGAVMAFSLGMDPTVDASPSRYGASTVRAKLCMLNEFREGDVCCGLNWVGMESTLPDREVPSYRNDPVGFKSAMSELADQLEHEGL